MKKVFYSALFFVAATSASDTFAQSNAIVKQSYVLPKTSITTTFTVETKFINKGPYAKFAQQYLGVTAPLNDSSTSSVVSSNIEGFQEADLSGIYVFNAPKEQNMSAFSPENRVPNAKGGVKINLSETMQFTDMGIDPIVYKASLPAGGVVTREKSLEQMAASAAETIFTLRKRRFDLITGELGENVFGAGLEAAIEEMSRLEAEYISLFIGKTTVTYKSYNYEVMPEVGKASYILARFSMQNGVVDMSDIAGDPIVLTVTPEGNVKTKATNEKVAKDAKKYRVADIAECKLYIASELVDSRRIGILQYGITVDL